MAHRYQRAKLIGRSAYALQLCLFFNFGLIADDYSQIVEFKCLVLPHLPVIKRVCYSLNGKKRPAQPLIGPVIGPIVSRSN